MTREDPKENRGRSAEARDPNRPIDPETGEKEGLGPRDGTKVDVDVETGGDAGADAGDGDTATETPEATS